MSNDSDSLILPPFPSMTWDDCESWNGEVDLAFGKGASLQVTPHDPSVTRTPSEEQCDAFTFQLENGESVVRSVLAGLQRYYCEMRPRFANFLGAEFDQLMPAFANLEQLRGLIDLCAVHIHPWKRNGRAYVGLQFGCTWDREHGFGVLLHGDRVVDLGGADVSFAWAPDEADESA